MFTGLIQEVGSIEEIIHTPNGRSYRVTCPYLAPRLAKGSSIAVNGVCLTVTKTFTNGFAADTVFTTLQKTNLIRLKKGSPVNLEPALRMGDPLDGHLMQGHVNGTGRLLAVRKVGVARELEIVSPPGIKDTLIPEGSVAIDGVSLTVSKITEKSFCVAIIPETWDVTNLSTRRIGDLLNVEGDILARTSERGDRITERKLYQWGYGI